MTLIYPFVYRIGNTTALQWKSCEICGQFSSAICPGFLTPAFQFSKRGNAVSFQLSVCFSPSTTALAPPPLDAPRKERDALLFAHRSPSLLRPYFHLQRFCMDSCCLLRTDAIPLPSASHISCIPAPFSIRNSCTATDWIHRRELSQPNKSVRSQFSAWCGFEAQRYYFAFPARKENPQKEIFQDGIKRNLCSF